MVKRVVSPQIIKVIARHLTTGATLDHDEGSAEGPNDKVAIAFIRRECIISAPTVSTRAAKAKISGLVTMVYNEDQRG